MEYIETCNGIRPGDSIRRLGRFDTEGKVTAIMLIGDSKWFEVAVDGDMTHIELICVEQVEKTDKQIPVNRGGQLVLS